MKLLFNLSNDTFKEITFNENIESLLLYEYDKINNIYNRIDLKIENNEKTLEWRIITIEDNEVIHKKSSKRLNDLLHSNHIYKYLKFNRDFDSVCKEKVEV